MFSAIERLIELRAARPNAMIWAIGRRSDVGVDGVDRGGAGTGCVALGGGEKKWCQGGGQDLHKHVGVEWFPFGHASRPGLRLLLGLAQC